MEGAVGSLRSWVTLVSPVLGEKLIITIIINYLLYH